MRLHWKLMLTYTSVIILVVASVHFYLDRATRTFLVGQLGDTLGREVRVRGDLPAYRPGAEADRHV